MSRFLGVSHLVPSLFLELLRSGLSVRSLSWEQVYALSFEVASELNKVGDSSVLTLCRDQVDSFVYEHRDFFYQDETAGVITLRDGVMEEDLRGLRRMFLDLDLACALKRVVDRGLFRELAVSTT